MHTNIDTPQCPNCESCVDLSSGSNSGSGFESEPITALSGSMKIQNCPFCGCVFYVTPSIEWQTWEVDDETKRLFLNEQTKETGAES